MSLITRLKKLEADRAAAAEAARPARFPDTRHLEPWLAELRLLNDHLRAVGFDTWTAVEAVADYLAQPDAEPDAAVAAVGDAALAALAPPGLRHYTLGGIVTTWARKVRDERDHDAEWAALHRDHANRETYAAEYRAWQARDDARRARSPLQAGQPWPTADGVMRAFFGVPGSVERYTHLHDPLNPAAADEPPADPVAAPGGGGDDDE